MRPFVLVALVLFAFWQPLLGGASLGPDDQQWLSDPFNADPPPGLIPELAERDAATIHGEWVAWADTIRSGDVAWWTDVGAGQPLLENGLPLTHLVYLVAPSWYAAGLAAALAVLLAAFGAMRLADQRGLAPLAGLFVGVVFGFSGFMFVWLGWPHATAIAFAPWVIGGFQAIAITPSVRRIGSTGLAIAAQLWCGVFIIASLTVVAGAVWAIAARTTRAATAGVVSALGLGGALAAPFLLPRWERWSWADTTHLPTVDESSAALVALVTSVFGNGLGNPAVGFGWVTTGSFQLSVVFVGVTPMAMALLGFVTRPRSRGPVGLVAVGVAVAYLGGPFSALATQFAGDIGEATHARFLVVLGVALLAGQGVDTVLDSTTTPAGLRRTAQAASTRIAVGGLVVVTLVVGWRWIDVVRGRGLVRELAAQAFGPVLIVVLVALVAAMWWRRTLTPSGVASAVLAFAAYELLTFGMSIPTVTASDERPVATAAHQALHELVDGSGRIAGDHDVFPPFVAAQYGFSDVRAPDLRSTGEIAVLEAVDSVSVRGASGGSPFAPVFQTDDGVVRFDHPTWDLLGVDAWVMTRDAEPPGPRIDPQPTERIDLDFAPTAGVLTIPEGGLWGVAFDARFPAFTRITVRVEAGGVAVGNDVVFAGARNGIVVVPVLGESFPSGADAQVSLTLDPGARPASMGIEEDRLSLGTVGARRDLRLVWVDGAVILDRPTPRARLVGAEGVPLEIEQEAGRLTIELDTDRGGMVQTDIIAEPGWTVRADGETVEAVIIDDVVLGVDVAAGRQVVTFTYRPPRLGIGLILAVLAGLGWALALVAERRIGTPAG